MFEHDSELRPCLSVINESQIERMYRTTLGLLEHTGVQVTHPRALELLHGAGARVDGDRVRIPAWMVEDAIREAPSCVVLGNRNGERTAMHSYSSNCKWHRHVIQGVTAKRDCGLREEA